MFFSFFFGSPLKGFLRCASAIFLTLSELMRGKVTADAYSGGKVNWGGGDSGGAMRGVAMRGGCCAWRSCAWGCDA